jgi:hypothetical protein
VTTLAKMATARNVYESAPVSTTPNIFYNPDIYAHDTWVFVRMYAGFVLALFFGSFKDAILAVFLWYTFVSWMVRVFKIFPVLDGPSPTDVSNFAPELSSLYIYMYTAFMGVSSGMYLVSTLGDHRGIYDAMDLQWPPDKETVHWALFLVTTMFILWMGGLDCGVKHMRIGCHLGNFCMVIYNSIVILLFIMIDSPNEKKTAFMLYWLASLWYFSLMFLTPVLLLLDNVIFATVIYLNFLALVTSRAEHTYQWLLFYDGSALLTIIYKCMSYKASHREQGAGVRLPVIFENYIVPRR